MTEERMKLVEPILNTFENENSINMEGKDDI